VAGNFLSELVDWFIDAHQTRVSMNAAVCGLLGRLDQGRNSVQRLLALLDASTIESTRAHFEPFAGADSPALHALVHGLRQSGLPEGLPKRRMKTRS
jgi:hypothetical protein